MGPGVDTDPLLGWIPSLGLVLAVWGIGWPVVESVRFLGGRRAGEPPHVDLSADRPRTPAATRDDG